jgi:hypothetical protein
VSTENIATAPADKRERRIAQRLMYCQHYDAAGVTMIGGKEPHGHCKAGVNYLQQFGAAEGDNPRAGIFMRICCTDGNKRGEAAQRALCPQWLRTTREQGETHVDELERVLQRMEIVGPAVAAWRQKPPRGKQEVIECPACKGRLHLSQSAYNGHVHGRCETPGCASWAE